jgi:hypothetical protein
MHRERHTHNASIREIEKTEPAAVNALKKQKKEPAGEIAGAGGGSDLGDNVELF